MAMLQIRPTFSESWYRVAGLKAKLRPSAQISRQFYRGDRWYVVRDPAGNQFHRLSDAAYRFLGLLDGRRTVQEAWDLCGGQLADDAPTQPEVIHILSQLHAANLLEADITPDSAVLLKRYKQMQKRQWQGRLMNILFPRIPLWDPDQFLKRWMAPMRFFFLNAFGALVWLGMIVAALVMVLPRWTELRDAAGDTIDPKNWAYLWAAFVVIKLIHELGHAFICRRFGGEVHELGVMFLVLIPAPYVDASTAWAFPSRWQRMLVGAGGMIFELFVAAIAAFVWLNTSSGELVHQLSYNVMFIASVSTILFNANPLLRYDGYYMLSDWLEIPNLRQKSTEYALGLIKRHVFRIKSPVPLPPPMQRVWLLSYAVTSSIYRVWIGVLIIVMVAWKVPILGTLMALGGIITWLVVPVVKTLKYLMIEPELHRKRGRATAFTAAVVAAVVVLVGLIHWPTSIDAQGIVEPGQKDVIKAGWEGFVRQIQVRDGERVSGPRRDKEGNIVQPGQVLVAMENPELESQIRETEAELQGLQARRNEALVKGPSEQHLAQLAIEAKEKKLAELKGWREALTVRATMDGKVIAPQLHEKPGMFLPRGTELLTIAQLDTVVVRANIDQRDYQLWWTSQNRREAEICLASRVREVIRGQVKVLDAAMPELVHESMGFHGGGQVDIDPRDPQGKKPKIKQFEMWVTVDNPATAQDPDGALMPGQRAYVRCNLDKTTLMWQWTRRFMQLLQANKSTQWM